MLTYINQYFFLITAFHNSLQFLTEYHLPYHFKKQLYKQPWRWEKVPSPCRSSAYFSFRPEYKER